MDKQGEKLKQKKAHSFYTRLTILIFLVILLITLAVVVPATVYFLHRGESRDVLSAAKTVRLSVTANAYEYMGKDSAIKDAGRQNGLSKKAEKDILELAGCGGEILYVDFDSQTIKVHKLVYLEKGYMAVYDDAEEELVWNVYRMDRLFP